MLSDDSSCLFFFSVPLSLRSPFIISGVSRFLSIKNVQYGLSICVNPDPRS